MTDNPPECTFDLNPLGGLCRVLDEQTHRAILGPLVGRALWGMAIFAIVLVAGRISRGIVHHALDRANTDAQVRTLVNNVMVAAGQRRARLDRDRGLPDDDRVGLWNCAAGVRLSERARG